ncbi:uncharacterized protein LOC129724469 [Wyeomyia smithii]|uniref:uncharacterized protein LOC129724469 n=1 Tax=Wyeomyia smithii TaxID=174621 RepID=UPI002467C982|nr:uncharacterized protein LOC129724469 [Wyeomyia smithii]
MIPRFTVPLLIAILLTALTTSAIAVSVQYSDPYINFYGWQHHQHSTQFILHNGLFSELANKTTIRIESGSPSDNNLSLLQSFWTKRLLIRQGIMRNIAFPLSPKYFYAYDAPIENLLIESHGHYQMEELRFYAGKLSRLPANLDRLRALRVLLIKHNQIDSIDMSEFKNLENLEEVSLEYNHINIIQTTSTLSLPVIQKFSLLQNNLAQLDICLCDMPALETFDTSGNKLQHVACLDSLFPELRFLRIYDNPLDCSWKRSMLRDMTRANTKVEFLSKVTCVLCH